jgi:hypothetical protein
MVIRNGFKSSALVFVMASSVSGPVSVAWAQGQAQPDVKVNLPASPDFNQQHAPEKYPSGELSVYGLRHSMSKYLDKDVQVKGYLLEVYECPADIRKCNDDLAAKSKRQKKAPPKPGALPGKPGAAAEGEEAKCRPCDQPHFFVADTATTKKERALLVADYPVKDWDSGKPKPLTLKAGEQVTVTGTFAINSITGFAASNGLIIHKRLQDGTGKVVAEGNAVLPPEAQTIQLEGKPPEPLQLSKKK